MSRGETTVLFVWLLLIIGWALLGPRGWVWGVVGGVIGVAVGVGMVVARRRHTER